MERTPPLGNPDLVTVSTRIPSGVICLISALSFYELTNQIPHEVHVALPRGAEEPRLDHPPIKTYRFTGEAFTEGVDTHELDGVSVRIYSPEKTLADCFKFRNQVGLDTVMEAVTSTLSFILSNEYYSQISIPVVVCEFFLLNQIIRKNKFEYCCSI